MVIVMVLLAIVGGALLSVQAAINGRLGGQVGILKCAFLTFSLGALVTGLLIFFVEPLGPQTLLEVPRWQVMGALCGVPYIIIMVLAVQRIGSAIATVSVIFGQLLMSIIIDNYGWLGNHAIPVSGSRWLAMALLAAALVLIYQSNRQPEAKA